MSVMDPDRWRRLQPILDEALTVPPEERERLLDRACAADPDLREAVERVLRADAAPGGVLDTPSGVFLDAIMRELQQDRTARTASVPPPAGDWEQSRRGDFLPGTILAGRYRVVSLIGRGGMGEVYRADDLRLGQAVALKFVAEDLTPNPEYLRRLTNEARLARQVSHPNVCRVYDIGDAGNRQFLTMEFVDGEDLASLVTRIGLLPQPKALDIARQLCAGLDAAHRQGVLHRDLKPANVMLDARGQVRITDFGLAVAREASGSADIHAGTPAYMAPEQLEGRAATVRSDLYALGLVLYELFTGKRAVQPATPSERPGLRDDAVPAPGRLIDGFNPSIERIILACLERDPQLRPSSASEVAAALPGGDPISAALADGVTPSPDLVAVSGPEGAIASRTATVVLLATIGALVLLVALSDRVSILGWTETRSPDVLEEHARGIIQRLGYDAAALDRTSGFDFLIPSYWGYVQRQGTSPDRWNLLREPGQIPSYFAYRQAPRYLAPQNWDGRVGFLDQVPLAGDIVMTTNFHGRLIYFQAIPEDATRPVDPAPSFDWSVLFAEAGLRMADFTPIPPTRNPPVATDVRAAWSGALDDFGGFPVRVEAALLHGRPVFFELVVPWDSYWEPSSLQAAHDAPGVPAAPYFLVIVFWLVTAGVLVMRNWASGRGDRRGAFRLASLVFALRFMVWIFGGHHVPSFWEEFQMFLIAVGKALLDGAVTWAYYMALEPHARKLYPRLLIAWTRMLRGHLRDPLVGREILYGVALSTIAIACWIHLYVLIPHVLRLDGPPAPARHPIGSPAFFLLLDPPQPRTILGGRHALEGLPAMALYAIGFSLTTPLLLLGLQTLLRKKWAAIGGYLVIVTFLAWPTHFADFHPVAIACSLAGGVAMLWALRLGLVSLVVLWFCLGVWANFPITARTEAPYFEAGLLGVLAVAGLAMYGASIATWPRRIDRPAAAPPL